MKYRIEFRVSRDDGPHMSDTYEFEPFEQYERDAWSIGADLGEYVTSVAEDVIWAWISERGT